QFKEGSKRQDRVNARVRYIEGDITAAERPVWEANFVEPPPALSLEEKDAFMRGLSGVSLSSDAFFPFRDNIDRLARAGVQCIAQAGGSVRDDDVIAAANEHRMTMAMTGVRLFLH
ncbi:MAG: phosphoribosylaminoimidazolecarboxamide formyltransferase, partial [Planctomycetota bacterium]